jgi:enoyl-CoA hydratase/carnithine racemase
MSIDVFYLYVGIYSSLHLDQPTLPTIKFIELEKIGINESIAVLTINRPDVLNAINIDVIAELSSAFDTVGSDDRTRVVIITGA